MEIGNFPTAQSFFCSYVAPYRCYHHWREGPPALLPPCRVKNTLSSVSILPLRKYFCTAAMSLLIYSACSFCCSDWMELKKPKPLTFKSGMLGGWGLTMTCQSSAQAASAIAFLVSLLQGPHPILRVGAGAPPRWQPEHQGKPHE